jgi:RNA polymerase sigma-70 factor (ECF subfamily)
MDSSGSQSLPQDDFEALQRALRGDASAFDGLFQKYVSRVYNHSLKMLRNEAEAEENVQEVFLTVIRKGESFRGESAFSTWLYRLTANTAISRLRKNDRVETEEFMEEFMPKYQPDGHHLTPVLDWAENPEKRFLGQEFQEQLQEALDMLSPLDKTIVLMSDYEGLKYKEIAEAIELSLASVKSRLHRARLFLRGKIDVFNGHPPH